jgi:hypothetical protein
VSPIMDDAVEQHSRSRRREKEDIIEVGRL